MTTPNPAHASTPASILPLQLSLLTPGLRVAVGLSGGADSVALTRALAARSAEQGIVLHAAHLHHGLRGDEADEDQAFAADLALSLGIPFHSHRVDTAAESARNASGKGRESIEEAARRLRYAWFRELMAAGVIDAVATAHTLDDQAETVLGKLLRGAWTEGLSGIHPVVNFSEGRILRPLLGATRAQVEAYLRALNQPWRDDSSNRDPVYTRNRLRADLLPNLEQWNPQIRGHLSQMAELARDEEAWWQAEMERLAPQLLLSGRPVRGGGRAASDDGTIAIDVVRLGTLAPAVQRRLLRYAAAKLHISLDFQMTERLVAMVATGQGGQTLSLPGSVTAERTARELRLGFAAKASKSAASPTIELPVPGEAVGFGWRFRAETSAPGPAAQIRNWRPGDRVTLRYSSGPRKVKEILERLKVAGSDRGSWPVIEWKGVIVWMQGVELEPASGAVFRAEADLEADPN